MSQESDFSPVEEMDLCGGDLCLDFTNTASGRAGRAFNEKLHGYGDLVTWAERVELAGPERAKRLRLAAARAPEEAESVLARARALRESVFRLFTGAWAVSGSDSGAAGGGATGPEGSGAEARADLTRVSEEAGRAAAERRLVADEDGYRFEWPESDRLEQLLWPVALSAVELLTSEERGRVKECASDTCDWLFLDLSRNRSRRWCDMKVCGNRAKARRFTARQKGEGGGG